MRYSILFVATLILVSGFIAYFGDMLGRWLGKKRLTIGRLRPRHTAYAVTAITGMLISTMAVLALVAVNSEFRQVLTQGEQILRQNKSLSRTNSVLGKLNSSLRQRGARLQSEVTIRQREVTAARAEAAKAKAERDNQLKVVARLKQEVEARTREIAERRTQLARLERELESVKNESELAKAEIALKADELERVRRSLTTVQSNLQSANAKLAKANRDYDEARMRLKDTNEKLAQAETTLRQQEAAIRDQQETIEGQRQRIIEVGKQALKFQAEKDVLSIEKDVLRSGRLILRQGDEVIRGIISPRQSVFGIRADLFSLLDEASARAAKIGAGSGRNGRAVTLIFRQPVSREYAVINEDETANVHRAAEAIAQSPTDALVQVVCARNSIQGEQVPVEFMLYINKIVYRKGDRIAGTTLDGRDSEGRILLSVIKFLQEDVSVAALENGIIPIANPDSRVNTGPNPRTQVEGLMNVVDQIKSKNARVTADVYATADIYAIGPLNMDNMRFSVAKLQ